MRQERVLDAFAAMPRKPPHPIFRCANPDCGVEFTPSRPWQKFHTANCRKQHWLRNRRPKPTPALTCPHCGQPVTLSLVEGRSW